MAMDTGCSVGPRQDKEWNEVLASYLGLIASWCAAGLNGFLVFHIWTDLPGVDWFNASASAVLALVGLVLFINGWGFFVQNSGVSRWAWGKGDSRALSASTGCEACAKSPPV